MIKVTPQRPVGMFIDYWKDDERTSAVHSNGWYYTQDKAYRDSEGRFWFVGRSDDVFKSSGYRIGKSVFILHVCR